MSDIQATLDARKAVHGDFGDHARITQAFKDIVHGSPSWPRMTPVAREAVEMIVHKLGRICAGDPTHADHFHDVAGYARLAEERIAAINTLSNGPARAGGATGEGSGPPLLSHKETIAAG